MGIEFFWDVFGLLLGDKIFAVVTGIGILLTLNGLALTAVYYIQARRLILTETKNLPTETEELLALRKQALRNRKTSLGSESKYIACNWKLFERLDDLTADERISSSSTINNYSFSLYFWLSPAGMLARLSSTAKVGLWLLISGQLILAFAIGWSLFGALLVFGAMMWQSFFAANYEAILNSIKPSSSKAA